MVHFRRVKCNPPVVSKKLCGTHGILDEAVRKRKEQEQERRKLRLLQVREIGKQLARKIRNDVAAEKLRQLQKLEVIKAKELECWRKHLLERQNRGYQDAIFQVGRAHLAAQTENKQKELKHSKCGTERRKLPPAKKCTNNKSCSCPCSKSTKTTPEKKQFKCVCTQTEQTEREVNHHQSSSSIKRKRDVSTSSDDSDSEDNKVIDISTSTSSSSYASHTAAAVKKSQKPSIHIFRRPNISVDVEVFSDDVVTVSAGDRVPHKSNAYCTAYNEISCENSNKDNRVDSDEDNTLTDSTSTPPREKPRMTKDKVKNIATKTKKYSAVANLVRKQQSSQMSSTAPPSSKLTSRNDKSEKRSTSLPTSSSSPRRSPVRSLSSPQAIPAQRSPSCPSSPRTSPPHRSPSRPSSPPSRPSAPHPSPSGSCGRPQQSQKTTRKQISPRKSAKSFADKSVNTATVSKSTPSNSSTRVQFYDYNYKQSKEYVQSPKKYLNRQLDRSKPSAMEFASQEKQMQKQREEEVAKQQKIIEERGQKALEREQIRNECSKLTDKLEVLRRQYANKLPSEETTTHIFDDKKLRKETKMNAAIEEILKKPAIITCAEINDTMSKATSKQQEGNEKLKKGVGVNEINLGAKAEEVNDSVSDSCCSILLEYLDEQSNQIRSDLNQFKDANAGKHPQQQKIQRLKDLLTRLDELRNCLLNELNNGNENLENVGKHYVENVQEVAKSISDFRKADQAKAFNKAKSEEMENTSKQRNDKDDRILSELEKCIEKKLNQCHDVKNAQTCTDKNTGKPLEIVITVKDPSLTTQTPMKAKKKVKHSPVKAVRHHTKPRAQTKSKTLAKLKTEVKQRELLERPNSFNSNSTAYCSLPSEITTFLEAYVSQLSSPRKQDVESNSDNPNVGNVKAGLSVNPLIAQYIQRLLSMPGNALQSLAVSSSEIETPSSSMLQTPSNLTSSDDLVSRERLEFVEKFLEENRSFINEIEKNLQKSNKQNLASTKGTNVAWSIRLKNSASKMAKDKTQPTTTPKKPITDCLPSEKSKSKPLKKRVKINQNKSTLTVTSHKLDHKDEVTQTSDSPMTTKQNAQDKVVKKGNSNQAKVIDNKSQTYADKCVETQPLPLPYSATLDRNRQLSEGCANRIADLNDLINRVREDKQRLLEGTLSSISDENCCHSSEYLDLPEENTRRHPDTRNANAADNRQKQLPSAEYDNPNQIRKLKPPVTIRRFSPQLMEDDVVVHELSTILEVETPTVSQMNTEHISAIATGSDKPLELPTNIQPVLFPTFEEYVKQMKLNLSQLDAEQSIQLHKDFCNHIEYLYQSITQPAYQEFPSIKAYMENFANGEVHLSIDLQSKSDVDTQASSSNNTSSIKPHYFPTLKEYINNRLTDIDKQTPMLDSKSLENMSDDSETMNIEEELRRRNILKQPFRFASSQPVLTSTAQSEQIYCELLPVESGIEKLSTTESENTVDNFRKEIKRIVNMWPENYERKAKETSEAGSSSTSATANTNSLTSSSNPSYKKTTDTATNLRDFLTKELLKHANNSLSTSSSAEESIRNQFLNSIIDLLTPSRTAAKRKPAPERPKTSTPLQTASSSCPSTTNGYSNSNTSSSQLFTGESSMSTVYHTENQRNYKPKQYTYQRKSS